MNLSMDLYRWLMHGLCVSHGYREMSRILRNQFFMLSRPAGGLLCRYLREMVWIWCTSHVGFPSWFYKQNNYHPIHDFAIDLDNVWKWLGFNQKYNAKRVLDKFFVLDKDYKILLLRDEEQDGERHGGHNKQTILLNIHTFKRLCMKAATTKADQIQTDAPPSHSCTLLFSRCNGRCGGRGLGFNQSW